MQHSGRARGLCGRFRAISVERRRPSLVSVAENDRGGGGAVASLALSASFAHSDALLPDPVFIVIGYARRHAGGQEVVRIRPRRLSYQHR